MTRGAHVHREAKATPAELVVDGRKAADVVAHVVSHVMRGRLPGHAGACSSEGMERWQGSFTVAASTEPVDLIDLVDLVSESVDVCLRVGGEDYVIWLDDGVDDDHLNFTGSGPSPRG